MPTEDDLRTVLQQLDADAPTVADVTRGIEPARRRRGRRVWPLPAVAGVVVVLVVALVVVLRDRSEHRAQPATTSGSLKLGFRVGSVPGFTLGAIQVGVGGEGEQDVSNAKGVVIGIVKLTDPSIFDRMPLVSKEPVTLAGHAAYYAQQRLELISYGPSPPTAATDRPGTLPVVAWQVTPSKWLLVSPSLFGSPNHPDLSTWGRDIRTKLMAIAAAVHTDETTQVALPFRIAGAPPGAVATQAYSNPASVAPGGYIQLTNGPVSLSINVVRPVNYSPAVAGSTSVAVGRYTGSLFPNCGAEFGSSGQPAASSCTLQVRAGVWQVELSAKATDTSVTPSTVIEFGKRLVFATDSHDISTWFDATKVVD